MLGVKLSREGDMSRRDLITVLARDPKVESALTKALEAVNGLCPSAENPYAKDTMLGDLSYALRKFDKMDDNRRGAIFALLNTISDSPPVKGLKSFSRISTKLQRKVGLLPRARFSEPLMMQGGQTTIGPVSSYVPSRTLQRHEYQKQGNARIASNLSEEQAKGELLPQHVHPDALMENQSLPKVTSIQNAMTDTSSFRPLGESKYETSNRPRVAERQGVLHMDQLQDSFAETRGPMYAVKRKQPESMSSRVTQGVKLLRAEDGGRINQAPVTGSLNITAYQQAKQGVGGQTTMGADAGVSAYTPMQGNRTLSKSTNLIVRAAPPREAKSRFNQAEVDTLMGGEEKGGGSGQKFMRNRKGGGRRLMSVMGGAAAGAGYGAATMVIEGTLETSLYQTAVSAGLSSGHPVSMGIAAVAGLALGVASAMGGKHIPISSDIINDVVRYLGASAETKLALAEGKSKVEVEDKLASFSSTPTTVELDNAFFENGSFWDTDTVENIMELVSGSPDSFGGAEATNVLRYALNMAANYQTAFKQVRDKILEWSEKGKLGHLDGTTIEKIQELYTQYVGASLSAITLLKNIGGKTGSKVSLKGFSSNFLSNIDVYLENNYLYDLAHEIPNFEHDIVAGGFHAVATDYIEAVLSRNRLSSRAEVLRNLVARGQSANDKGDQNERKRFRFDKGTEIFVELEALWASDPTNEYADISQELDWFIPQVFGTEGVERLIRHEGFQNAYYNASNETVSQYFQRTIRSSNAQWTTYGKWLAVERSNRTLWSKTTTSEAAWVEQKRNEYIELHPEFRQVYNDYKQWSRLPARQRALVELRVELEEAESMPFFTEAHRNEFNRIIEMVEGMSPEDSVSMDKINKLTDIRLQNLRDNLVRLEINTPVVAEHEGWSVDPYTGDINYPPGYHPTSELKEPAPSDQSNAVETKQDQSGLDNKYVNQQPSEEVDLNTMDTGQQVSEAGIPEVKEVKEVKGGGPPGGPPSPPPPSGGGGLGGLTPDELEKKRKANWEAYKKIMADRLRREGEGNTLDEGTLDLVLKAMFQNPHTAAAMRSLGLFMVTKEVGGRVTTYLYSDGTAPTNRQAIDTVMDTIVRGASRNQPVNDIGADLDRIFQRLNRNQETVKDPVVRAKIVTDANATNPLFVKENDRATNSPAPPNPPAPQPKPSQAGMGGQAGYPSNVPAPTIPGAPNPLNPFTAMPSNQTNQTITSPPSNQTNTTTTTTTTTAPSTTPASTTRAPAQGTSSPNEQVGAQSNMDQFSPQLVPVTENLPDTKTIGLLRPSLAEGGADIVSEVLKDGTLSMINKLVWQSFNTGQWEANEEGDNPLHMIGITEDCYRFSGELDKDDVYPQQQDDAVSEEYAKNIHTAYDVPDQVRKDGVALIIDTITQPECPSDSSSTDRLFHDVYLPCWADIPESSPWKQFTAVEGTQIPDSLLHNSNRLAGNDWPLLASENAFIFTTLE